jgi:hypothetical protein
MKSIFEWHALQDGFIRLLEQTKLSVRLVFFRLEGGYLMMTLSARQKPTASQVAASYTLNVAPDRCRKHNPLRVPA